MTRREFAEQSKVARKAEKRFNFLWGFFFFGILIGNWLYITIYDPEMPAPFWIAYLIIFLGFLWGNIPFTRYMNKKIQRDAGMECGICQELLDSNSVALAVTTGNCTHCSQKFLAD